MDFEDFLIEYAGTLELPCEGWRHFFKRMGHVVFRPIFSKVPPAMAIYGNLLTEDLTEAQLQLAKKLKAEANFRTFALQGLRVPKDGQGVNTG